MDYAIRLPAKVLQDKIGYLLKGPVGRPPHEMRTLLCQLQLEAQSWKKPRRVVAKVEWHPGDRPTAGTNGASMRAAAVRYDSRRLQRGALMKAKRRVPALRRKQPDDLAANGRGCDRISLRRCLNKTENRERLAGNRRKSV